VSPSAETDAVLSGHRASTEDSDTRTRILDAAFRCLTTRGYASLTVRDIARDAGVNHALISYYFGSKEKLVIAVLDEMNRRLLARQRSMYAAPGGYAEKWAAARRFYEDDVASGFVRVQAELYAASFANAELREQFLPRVGAWKQVVLEAVQEALSAYRPSLPPAFTAEAIASMISEFWLGMEFARLIGGSTEKARHDKALDAVEALLVALERMPLAGAAAHTEEMSRDVAVETPLAAAKPRKRQRRS
jgi:AcrR family transcriptional regulator